MQRVASLVQLAEWTGFLAAQLYNAGTAVVAHVPSWLPGVNMQRETVWLRRLVLLESFAPVPGFTSAMVSLPHAACQSLFIMSLRCAWHQLCSHRAGLPVLRTLLPHQQHPPVTA